MPEPTKRVPGRIVISPDDKARSRSWPDPRLLDDDLVWKVQHNPDHLTRLELRRLMDMASTYAYIFSIPQRSFLPTHAAIRAHLATPAEPAAPEHVTESDDGGNEG
jgi:hypothetical protein